ncbi:MAG: caspase family protein [Ferruginibacter sp.]
MSAETVLQFSKRLEKFKKQMLKNGAGGHPQFILINMANTHDPAIGGGCVKDAKAVQQVFKNISAQTHYGFSTIDIAGDHYNRKNLEDAIEAINSGSEEDVIIFYYTGHGFTYELDKRRKFPQIDLRAHGDKKKYNKIDFINNHTENLSVILQLMRLRGSRINIVIGDCCSSGIAFKRTDESYADMARMNDLLPPVNKRMTQKLFSSKNHTVSMLISASQRGQYAISDPKIGSIFTYHFTRLLAATLAKESKGGQYLHWQKILNRASQQTFKISKTYDIGGGKPGHQEAIFDILVEKEG